MPMDVTRSLTADHSDGSCSWCAMDALIQEQMYPVCLQAGLGGEALVLFLDDTQMIHDAFLADIHSILVTGAALFSKTIAISKDRGLPS